MGLCPAEIWGCGASLPGFSAWHRWAGCPIPPPFYFPAESIAASRTTLPDPSSPLHCSISVQGCQSLGMAQLRARLCLLHAFSSSAWGQIFFQNAWLSPQGAGFVSDGQVGMGPERRDSVPQSSWGSTGYRDRLLCRGFGVLAPTWGRRAPNPSVGASCPQAVPWDGHQHPARVALGGRGAHSWDPHGWDHARCLLHGGTMSPGGCQFLIQGLGKSQPLAGWDCPRAGAL